MHIRDEHLRKKNKLFLRQCAFGVNAESASNRMPSRPSSTAPSTVDIVMAGPSDDQLPTGSVAAETDSGTRSTQSIIHLTSQLIAALKLDEDVDLTVSHSNKVSCRIGDIFNFESTHWIMSHRLSAVGSLEDEMELYNLLNLDASGDLDADVDDCFASVFTVD